MKSGVPGYGTVSVHCNVEAQPLDNSFRASATVFAISFLPSQACPNVNVQSRPMGPFATLHDVLHLEALAEAIKGLLIRRFNSEKNQAKTSLTHQPIVIKRKSAEAHITVDTELPIEPATNHLVTELSKPAADRERP